jgi:hypothetical protein
MGYDLYVRRKIFVDRDKFDLDHYVDGKSKSLVISEILVDYLLFPLTCCFFSKLAVMVGNHSKGAIFKTALTTSSADLNLVCGTGVTGLFGAAGTVSFAATSAVALDLDCSNCIAVILS